MAVFLINICKFNNCGIIFPSLGDLIQHIEDTHIDYDPKVVEQKEQAQPTCLPLSYVLRFITDAARKENPFLGTTGADLKRKLAIKHHSYSMSSSNRSNTPTGSELDEDEMIISESEDSNDSWTTEEFSSEFIMRYGSRHSGSGNGTPGNEKPFACPVPGCKKRYKNVNGIKYHSKNGHKKDGKVRKGYKCHCGKSYKTAQGLKSHALAAHNSSDIITNNSNVRSSSPSQSAGSLSPSSVSNLSGSSGGSSFTNLTNLNNIHNNNHTNNNNNSINQSQQTHQQSTANLITSSLSSTLSSTSLNQGNNTSLATANNTTTNNNISAAIATPVTTTTNLLRSNIGLISIKTSSGVKSAGSVGTTGNLIAANVTANKILKLTATVAAAAANNSIVHNVNNSGNSSSDNIIGQQKHDNIKIKFDSSSSNGTPAKLTLPGLVNLGILTPATSPKIQQQHHSTFVTASHIQQQQINAGTNINSSIIINNQGNNIISTNNNLDNLPLTPISPNMQTNINLNNNNNSNNKIIPSVVSVATATSGGTITINNNMINNNSNAITSTALTTPIITSNGFTLTTANVTNNGGLGSDIINSDDT